MLQERYKRGAAYHVTGPAKLKRTLKYIGKFDFEGDTILMFRHLRKGFVKKVVPVKPS